jgi:hypothetical protein
MGTPTLGKERGRIPQRREPLSAAFAKAWLAAYTSAVSVNRPVGRVFVAMTANAFWSGSGRPSEANGRPEGADPSSPASREQPPGQGGEKGEVVRVSPADVLPSAGLRPPTAQTFEELEIPANFRQAVERELTGDETLLWVGRPSRNPQVHPQNPLLPVIGGGLIALAVVIIVTMLVLSAGARPGGGGSNVFGFVFAGALGVIGLAFMLPLVVNPAKACRYCYAVTNRRALLVEFSLWQRGPVARSYLPQQLLGLERRDNAAVPGAGDLIFEYEFVLPGKTINPLTGSFLQQNSTGGMSNSPQRVPRGFMCLDQVREVEGLIRTTLLGQLEEALDAPRSADGDAPEHPARAVSVACACGVTIEAPAELAGKWVHCPRCTAAVAITAPEAEAGAAADPVSCREDGSVPAGLKEKALAGLDPNEKPVWVGRPVAKLVFHRSDGYVAVGGVGMLVALLWLVVALAPARAAAPSPQRGKQAAAPAKQQSGNLLLPVVLFFASACVAAVAVVRWHTARRTCYALTTRRALVYKEGLFGPTRESYSPLEVSGMRRSDSWLVAGCGDLIFRTVQVVSRSRGSWSSSVKTIHYGFLAVAQVGEVEKLVRETLIDRFVDRLNQASAL